MLISTTDIPAAAIPPATAATNTSASISRSDDTVISAVLLAVLIVTLSPISARAFSSRLTCAIEAAKPTRPTEAPTTTEWTPSTETLSSSGKSIEIPSPDKIAASTVTPVVLSIEVLLPMRDVTEPA